MGTQRAFPTLLLTGAILLGWGGRAAAIDYDETRVQVHLPAGLSIESVNDRYGTVTVDELPPHYLLRIPEGVTQDALLADMLNDPATFLCAERAWRDETPEGVRQMVVAAVGATIDDYLDQHLAERIHLAAMHAVTGGEGMLVAVLDTGVLASHEALAEWIAPGGHDFADNDPDPTDTANGIDDDGDGLVDEGAGHGTLVAGIVHLVAPEARILPIRVLDDEGCGTTFALAKGIRLAVAAGADVINMSLGLTDHSGIVTHELSQARLQGVAMVSAAGNLGVDNVLYFPACDARVLMVTALDSCDVKADFSNYHRQVSVSAPGVGILGPYVDGGYAIGAGTSFAVPFIAGQCALIRALCPGIAGPALYDLVYQGVAEIYSLAGNVPYVNKLGTGRFDALATLLVATGSAGVGVSGEPDRVPLRVSSPVISGGPVLVELALMQPAGAAGSCEIGIFDAAGRRLQSLPVPLGARSLAWDGRDARGHRLAAGAYWMRLSVDGRSAGAGRVVIVR